MKTNREIIGSSETMQELQDMMRRVASTRTSVLIIGESGTGKELVARQIHDGGPLAGKAFVPINCGAIPENLIESELFGHKKGSFTGAVGDKVGLFEAASGGTLFLDEIGELPLSMQVKLLRALQDHKIRRVGDTEDRKIDVRIIAATNRNLEDAIRSGRFREDLYYRLNVIQIKTPPLRERGKDVITLAEFFLKRCKERQGKTIKGFAGEVLNAFENYQWPGNVRELENVIERAVTLESGDEISLDVLSSPLQAAAREMGTAEVRTSGSGAAETMVIPAPDFSNGPIDLEEILSKIERLYLMKALDHSGGVKKKAAELLGITFRSIRYRLKKLGFKE